MLKVAGLLLITLCISSDAATKQPLPTSEIAAALEASVSYRVSTKP
jgi:hypothetical protein